MRIARFYQKTLFGVFAMIGLIVALTSALYVNTVDRQLTGDFVNNSRAIARSIADSNVDLIVHQNYSALQSIIDQSVEISSISYVFVVDEKGDIVSPSAAADFKFTINSDLVGCCTGRSASLAPFRIFPT